MWVEPVVPERGQSPAALVVLKDRTGDPSPNTLNSIHKGAGILALAFRLSRQG